MNIYQIIADELHTSGLSRPEVIQLQAKHEQTGYPIWTLKTTEPDGGSFINFEIVVDHWLKLSAYNRLFRHITNLHDIIAIYDIFKLKLMNHNDPDDMRFITWIESGSDTFRGIHDWEPFRHKFHKVSEIEAIVDKVASLVVDSELIHSLRI